MGNFSNCDLEAFFGCFTKQVDDVKIQKHFRFGSISKNLDALHSAILRGRKNLLELYLIFLSWSFQYSTLTRTAKCKWGNVMTEVSSLSWWWLQCWKVTSQAIFNVAWRKSSRALYETSRSHAQSCYISGWEVGKCNNAQL